MMSKKPMLVWLDLEMTGLNVHKDVLLEIATIVTDDELHEVAVGPNLVIHQSDEKLDGMDDWGKKQHASSGLIAEVKASKVTVAQAEHETLAFLEQQSEKGALLCGNSIWTDRMFLIPHMPQLAAFLGYRMIDVSSFKEMIMRWHPNDQQVRFKKRDKHRALPDVQDSIDELRHYKSYFLKK
jgi:oligoribonuclease